MKTKSISTTAALLLSLLAAQSGAGPEEFTLRSDGFIQQTEKTVGYAVAYVRSEAERTNLELKMGSNDEGKVYLNGKALLKTTEPRALQQDDDVAHNITLNKGVNVVVFKIFNEGGSDWQGCLRFTDTKGKAVTNFVIRLEQ